MSDPTPLRVDIVSDVVCPWCVIGYLEWQRALQEAPEFQATINWHPFELNPRLPASGENFRQHVQRKYGSSPQVSESSRLLQQRGAALGFAFRLDDDLTIHNTFRAHQLLYWLNGSPQQTDLQLALFYAHFIEHRNINDVDVLASLVSEIGLNESDAREVLSSGRFQQPVREQEQMWLERNVTGVPHTVVNDRFVITGAPDPQRLQHLLQKLRNENPAH